MDQREAIIRLLELETNAKRRLQLVQLYERITQFDHAHSNSATQDVKVNGQTELRAHTVQKETGNEEGLPAAFLQQLELDSSTSTAMSHNALEEGNDNSFDEKVLERQERSSANTDTETALLKLLSDYLEIDVDLGNSFEDFGIDSLTLAEIKTLIEKKFNQSITLTPNLTFDDVNQLLR